MRPKHKGWTVPDWPTEYGGGGLSPAEHKVLREEMSAMGARAPLSSFGIWMLGPALLKYGTEAQKTRFLGPTVRGVWPVASFALSESGAGSDAASLRCRAERTDGGWRLAGTKQWITSGDRAGVVLVMAKTDPTASARGISAFLLPGDAPGLSVGRHEEKLGLQGSSTVSLVLEDVFAADDQLLGQLGQGFEIAMVALDGGRCGIGAQALGMGRRALAGASLGLYVARGLIEAHVGRIWAEPKRYARTAEQKSCGRLRCSGKIISDDYQWFHRIPRPPFGLNRVCTASQPMREVRNRSYGTCAKCATVPL